MVSDKCDDDCGKTDINGVELETYILFFRKGQKEN